MSSRNALYAGIRLKLLPITEVWIASVICVAIVPILSLILLLFFKVAFTGFGFLITIAIQRIPVVSPVGLPSSFPKQRLKSTFTTVVLVGPYRRQLFVRMCEKEYVMTA